MGHFQLRGACGTALLVLLAAVAPASAAMNVVNPFPNLPYFSHLTAIVDPKDGTDRLFAVEQNGAIKVFQNDISTSTSNVFLDLSDSTFNEGESGLVGLAFHPNYANNGYFYVVYINKATLPVHWCLSRYHVSSNPNVADPNSEQRLIEVPQVTDYHKSGQVMFGADGYLYVSMGEDGQIYDAQNLTLNLKGKILRLDVDNPSGGKHYGIPPDNPFAGNHVGYREEIWAWGFRNAWRFSFDAPTGRLWAADVGLDTWEEIDIVKKGRNYGWPMIEGTQCDYPQTCDSTGYNIQLPLFEYLHTSAFGAAIVGGWVYHGTALPALQGRYIYADYPTDHIWALYWDGVHPPDNTELFHYPSEDLYRFTCIGQDKDNELFFGTYFGGIWKLVGSPTGVGDTPPSPAAILSASPNPFVAQTRIRITASGSASVQIYDVSGRLVQRLQDTGRGERDMAWDGRDLAGRRASSGVYFARLMVDGRAQGTRRIVLLK